MKKILFVVIPLVFFACQRELSQEGLNTANKPPIAKAGPDISILLPLDSILLDGSSSVDPDGSISEWRWTKIAGPSLFNINNPDSMKTILNNLTAGVYTFELKVTDNQGAFAKDTLQIIVNNIAQPNRPPVANAGNDLTIILPINSITLDGTNSTDPDNNITSYLWTKISGPGSFSITDINSPQTQATGLGIGIYIFELVVTDAGGLVDKDSIQVTVLSTQVRCDNSTRQTVNASLIPIGNLSGPKAHMSVASTANKIVFGGGYENPNSNVLSINESEIADIYDLQTNTWSTGSIGIGRLGPAATSNGNKIFFAGGGYIYADYFSQVSIYDAQANNWTYTSLSEAKTGVAAASVGNKCMFAGGYRISGDEPNNIVKTVEIYDLTTSNWTTAQLSQERGFMSAVTVNDKVYFAGGNTTTGGSAIIDIYDNATNSWSISSLQFITNRITDITGIALADKIYWTAGCQLEIFNTSTGTSTNAVLSYPGVNRSVIKDGKIIFIHTGSHLFDIYDPITNIWEIGELPQPILFGASIISVNNVIYVAGGVTGCSPSGNQGGCIPTYSTKVYKLEF